jgi:hypothetical protein
MFLVILMLGSSSGMGFAQTRFVDNGNGTVTDNIENVVWIQNPSVVPGIAGEMEWMTAKQACADLVYGGIGPNQWVMPRIEQLKSLLDKRFKNPQIDTGYFSAEGASYWSDTNYQPGEMAWTINFKAGNLGAYDKYNPDKPAANLVRCVAKV